MDCPTFSIAKLVTGVWGAGWVLTMTTSVNATSPALLMVPEKTSKPPGGVGFVGQSAVRVRAAKVPLAAASNAPMSTVPFTMRAKPRWSVASVSMLRPASMAALPQWRAWVKVGPPLFWRGPRLSVGTLTLNRSLGPLGTGPLVVPIRLCP